MPNLYKYLANALSNNNDKKGALQYFGEAIKRDPNNAELYLYDGLVKYNLNDKQGRWQILISR